MKLRLLTSLGMTDAKRFGLDLDSAHEGDDVDVDAKAGEELLKRGWATDAPAPKVKAEPTKPEPVKQATAPLSQPPKG